MNWLPWIGVGLLVTLVSALIVYRDRLFKRERAIPRDHHLSALEALADGDERLALGELQLAVQAGQGGVDAYLRLLGNDETLEAVRKGLSYPEILASYEHGLNTFRERRDHYLLYP